MSTHEYDETPSPSTIWLVALVIALVTGVLVCGLLWVGIRWVIQ